MDRQLPHCREENLSCHDCVAHAASKLAIIANGLNSLGVRQLFFAMYPAEPCRPMATAFIHAYHGERRVRDEEQGDVPLSRVAVA